MENRSLEELYQNGCCDILPSSEDFSRMIEIGVIRKNGEPIHIFEDPEPEEDQCKYRCLRESSRILDEHMKRMNKLTKERKDIEREQRELNYSIWNKKRAKKRAAEQIRLGGKLDSYIRGFY